MTGPASDWPEWLADQARQRSAGGLHRELMPRGDDDDLTDLAGNDYLGLARHPEVLAAAGAALKAFGLGATSSRLVRGSTTVHAELEAALASHLGCEAALVYSSGYLANAGALPAMARPGTLIVADAHNHASLVDGCRLARRPRDDVDLAVVAHADPAAVEAALAAGAGRPAVVVTESVFSVYGDLAPLARLHAVGRRHGALLLVDDAHGLGLLGRGGAGAVAAAGISGRPDVVVTATLSKALGAAGGVVAGSAAFIGHLVETGRTFIYDTALPPAVAAGALAALRLVRGAFGHAARAELAHRSATVCRRLRAAGFGVATPAGGVISVAAPGPAAALAWASACRARGVAVGCFRPPSTPDGSSRLRIALNAGVAPADFDRAVDVIVATAP